MCKDSVRVYNYVRLSYTFVALCSKTNDGMAIMGGLRLWPPKPMRGCGEGMLPPLRLDGRGINTETRGGGPRMLCFLPYYDVCGSGRRR